MQRELETELETATLEKINSWNLDSGPEGNSSVCVFGGVDSANLGPAFPHQVFSNLPMWSGHAFILKCTSFALAPVCTFLLTGNRRNPLMAKMCGPWEGFHKVAHRWLDLHKRFNVLWIKVNILKMKILKKILSMKMKSSKNSWLLTSGAIVPSVFKKNDFKKRDDKVLLSEKWMDALAFIDRRKI